MSLATTFERQLSGKAFTAAPTTASDPAGSATLLETRKGESRFLLRHLTPGKADRLGNQIKEILWFGTNYAIYRTDKGIHVQFSDCPKEEERQRKQFTTISAYLCELRFLTRDMMKTLFIANKRGLFEHNMAEAIMLLMEDQVDSAERLARHTLAMAVQRVSNDNTIRYVGACLGCFAVWIGACLIFLWSAKVTQFLSSRIDNLDTFHFFVTCSLFGGAGAVFSIATRLETFKLRPCTGSRMNYLMAGIRVGMGVVASIVLLLFAVTLYRNMLVPNTASWIHPPNAYGGFSPDSASWIFQPNGASWEPWERVAILGFIAGFAERLIPNLLLQTINKMQITDGTPVQAAGSEARAETRKNSSSNDAKTFDPALLGEPPADH
jgi:hypothetical protein